MNRSKYGVGKLIYGNLYVHKDCINAINDEQIRNDIYYSMKEFTNQYNVIRYNVADKTCTFIIVNDFDTANEPLPDYYYTDQKTIAGRQIWHHKWMMVSDEYKGFNIDNAKRRSQIWTNTMKDLDYRKIGNPKYWDEKLKEYNLEGRK